MTLSKIKIQEYINSVCNQIKWKKSHVYISNELENHIIDQKNAFISQGLNGDKAIENAITEMGDPVGVGTNLDKIHKPKIEWGIIGLTFIALLLGLVIQFFVTKDTSPTIGKSIVYSIIGIAAMIVAYLTDYTVIAKHPIKLFFGFLAIVLAIGIISPPYQGRSFYPKFFLLLYPTIFTGIIYSMRHTGYLGIVVCGLFMGTSYITFSPFALYSTYVFYSLLSLILLTISILMGWFNISKLKGVLLIYIPVIVTISYIYINNPYIRIRLMNALNPNLDPRGSGWMSIMTKEIISNSKFIGEGLATSSGYMVPDIYTDSLLTYLIHRFGWISLIIIVSVLAFLMIKSFKLCLKQNSVLGSLVSLSVVLTISAEIIIYIAYNLGFQLIAPLTLPLISYGGTGIIINMFLIGIMLSVFKWGNLVNDNVLVSKSNRFFSVNDGKVIIDFKFFS